MKKNISGFSLVVALWLVIVMTLLAVTILEFIIPFSRNNKWIENSSAAYYQANTWIENALYAVWTWSLWYEPNKWIVLLSPIDYSYEVTAMWDILPPDWQWNSEFDDDWDKISPWNPIQMEIWDNLVQLWNLNIAFRVPNFDNSLELSWATLPIINWQLSAKNNTLNAFSWNYITADDICESDEYFWDCDFYLTNNSFKKWIDLNDQNWTDQEISNFYTSNCTWTSSGCILKLSIINDLQTTDWEYIPYLEWRMEYGWWADLPLRYSIINSEWKSYWFKKSLQIKLPQKTVSEAFDFTVFQ